MRLVSNIFEHCHKHILKWNTMFRSLPYIRSWFYSSSRNCLYTCNAIAYRKALEAGLDIDDFAGRISGSLVLILMF